MKILYICTHNRCRSVISEAVTNQRANGLIEARSAGSQPAGQVHPLTLKYLAQAGYATDGLISQSWDDFAGFEPDVIITVCDSAAGEACPVYFSNSIKLHWGLSDPSKIEGSESEQAEAFSQCIALVEQRVAQLTQLAGQKLSKTELQSQLARLAAPSSK